MAGFFNDINSCWRNFKQAIITSLVNLFICRVNHVVSTRNFTIRYRQIIETESSEKLTFDEQTCLSEDEKHTSNVAEIQYQNHIKFYEIKSKISPWHLMIWSFGRSINIHIYVLPKEWPNKIKLARLFCYKVVGTWYLLFLVYY